MRPVASPALCLWLSSTITAHGLVTRDEWSQDKKRFQGARGKAGVRSSLNTRPLQINMFLSDEKGVHKVGTTYMNIHTPAYSSTGVPKIRKCQDTAVAMIELEK